MKIVVQVFSWIYVIFLFGMLLTSLIDKDSELTMGVVILISLPILNIVYFTRKSS